MHQQMSEPEVIAQQKQMKHMRSKRNDKKPILDPITYSISQTGEESVYQPQVNEAPKKGRTKVNDLIDNSKTPSLWSSYYSTSNLFSTNVRKQTGDIVIINVNKNLKEDISRELRKSFPLNTRALAGTPAPQVAGQPPTNKKQEEDKEDAVIVFDRVSSKIAEEIGGDYFLLKGRKEVYFRNKKRMVEVHALTKRFEIDANSEVMSDRVTETKVYILQ
jgi:flagellar basal body L-ring protein FlgH